MTAVRSFASLPSWAGDPSLGTAGTGPTATATRLRDLVPPSAPGRGPQTATERARVPRPPGPTRADRPTLPLPQQLGSYRLGRALARGGMSVVVSATSLEDGQHVALKVMRPTESGRRVEREAWDREVSILSALRHPGLVDLLDQGTGDGGELYLAMTLLEGRSARAELLAMRGCDPGARIATTYDRLIPAFLQICSTLQYAHDCGVLHCDLKPSNVFLPRGPRVAVLLDWGVSVIGAHWAPSEEGDGSRAGGTPGYMSPEQINSPVSSLDVRSDVYGLGALLYELVAWRPAFRKGSPERSMRSTLAGRLTPPHIRSPELGIPRALSSAILAALSRDRRDRPGSAAAMAEAVREAVYGR